MKTLIASATALVALAGSAMANANGCVTGSFGNQICTTAQVPEISALEGTAALAVVAAVVLLVWERRRRAM